MVVSVTSQSQKPSVQTSIHCQEATPTPKFYALAVLLLAVLLLLEDGPTTIGLILLRCAIASSSRLSVAFTMAGGVRASH